jgi:hypothetical protein
MNSLAPGTDLETTVRSLLRLVVSHCRLEKSP